MLNEAHRTSSEPNGVRSFSFSYLFINSIIIVTDSELDVPLPVTPLETEDHVVALATSRSARRKRVITKKGKKGISMPETVPNGVRSLSVLSLKLTFKSLLIAVATPFIWQYNVRSMI